MVEIKFKITIVLFVPPLLAKRSYAATCSNLSCLLVPLSEENILDANQSLHINYENFNLDPFCKSEGAQRDGEEDLQKCDYPIQG